MDSRQEFGQPGCVSGPAKTLNGIVEYRPPFYLILLLIATYGLRSSELINLKLEDIEWRNNRLKIYQRKNVASLVLPLTNNVGESIPESESILPNSFPALTYTAVPASIPICDTQ